VEQSLFQIYALETLLSCMDTTVCYDWLKIMNL